MPQSKGGGKKRKVVKSKAWYKKKYSVGDLASKAMQGVAYLRTMINSELKTFDSVQNTAAVTYNGTVTNLTAIAQGDSRVDRNGKSILCKSIFTRGLINSDSTNNYNCIRVIIFMDTMNTGTAPAMSDVLQYVGSSQAPLSALNQLASGRYKILWSKIFTLSKISNFTQVFKAYIDVNKHIKYAGALGTDEWKNQIYMGYVSSSLANGPQLQAQTRCSFYDN